jgi:ketosteroid isomerase-like protein
MRAESYRDHRVATARKFYELLDQMDVSSWQQLWHEDARIIVLYPPAGFPSEIRSRSTIVSGFTDLFGKFDRFDSQITAIYAADDSDAVCVEYLVRAKLVNGTEYTNANIAVFRFDDSLIREYRDYFDPRRFQVVVDALAASK